MPPPSPAERLLGRLFGPGGVAQRRPSAWLPVWQVLSVAEPSSWPQELRARGLFDEAAFAEHFLAVPDLSPPKPPRGWRVAAPASRILPARALLALGRALPPILWHRGALPSRESHWLAVVGSRRLSDAEAQMAEAAGAAAARLGMAVVSGGAEGADSLALGACVSSGGLALSLLPGGGQGARPLWGEATINPTAPAFSVEGAHRRNRWVYGSACAALVIASRFSAGGTWSGVIAARRLRLCPIFVYMAAKPSSGNDALARMGLPTVSSQAELEGRLFAVLESLSKGAA